MFFAVVFVLGILSMGFQLLASRLLNPHFGSSIVVWAWLISSFLAAFSVGSIVGGWTSQIALQYQGRVRGVQALAAVVSLALTAGFGRAVLDRVEVRFESIQTALFVSCMALFFVPVTALSTFGPHCVQWLDARGMPAGKASGWVYGVTTLGNIAGVMFTAFALIPTFRVSVLLWLWLGVAVTSLVTLLLMLRSDR